MVKIGPTDWTVGHSGRRMSLERGEIRALRTGTAARQAEATKEAILQSVARIVSEKARVR